jgi:hypothetical protein
MSAVVKLAILGLEILLEILKLVQHGPPPW